MSELTMNTKELKKWSTQIISISQYHKTLKFFPSNKNSICWRIISHSDGKNSYLECYSSCWNPNLLQMIRLIIRFFSIYILDALQKKLFRNFKIFPLRGSINKISKAKEIRDILLKPKVSMTPLILAGIMKHGSKNEVFLNYLFLNLPLEKAGILLTCQNSWLAPATARYTAPHTSGLPPMRLTESTWLPRWRWRAWTGTPRPKELKPHLYILKT